MKAKKDLDYIIVLGAHVDGTRLTLALLERTRRACQYLKDNPGTRAVLSGGKGSGEAVSEAQAMYRYLTGHGISGARLLKEETSANTRENIAFSLKKDRHPGRFRGDRHQQFPCVPGDRYRPQMGI